MLKKSRFFVLILAVLTLFLSFSLKTVNAYADNEKIYLGGFSAGFSVQTRGANIVGLCDVVTKNGIESPSKIADIRVGDIILSIDNQVVNDAKDIENALGNKE